MFSTIRLWSSRLFVDRRRVVLTLTLILGIFLWFTSALGAVVSVFALLAANFFLARFMRPFKRLRLGVELTLFGTILTGYAFGPQIGMLFALITSLSYYIGYKQISMYSVAVVPTYMVLGFLSGFFSSVPIAILGIAFAVLYHMIVLPITVVGMKASISKSFWFSFGNILWNAFLFSQFGSLILRFMI